MTTQVPTPLVPKPNKQSTATIPRSLEPLILESNGGITLRSGNAELRLLPNGELLLNGRLVSIRADEKVKLNAGQLRFNCPED